MVTVKRIHVASAFRVGALVSGILFGILSLCYMIFVFSALSSPEIARQLGEASGLGDAVTLSPINFLVTFLICGVPFYATIGGIFGMLFALVYNFVAGWVGGLEIELERPVMLQRSSSPLSGDPFAKRPDEDDPFGDLKGKDIP